MRSYRGDLVVTDPRPAAGDWVYARDNGAFILARLNAKTKADERRASLFWDLRHTSGAPLQLAPSRDWRSLPELRGAAVCRLVSWVAARYRIGVHSG